MEIDGNRISLDGGSVWELAMKAMRAGRAMRRALWSPEETRNRSFWGMFSAYHGVVSAAGCRVSCVSAGSSPSAPAHHPTEGPPHRSLMKRPINCRILNESPRREARNVVVMEPGYRFHPRAALNLCFDTFYRHRRSRTPVCCIPDNNKPGSLGQVCLGSAPH